MYAFLEVTNNLCDIHFSLQDYMYCSSCRGVWTKDSDTDSHPNHSGEYVGFSRIDIIPEFVTKLEEQSLCESVDAGEWTASQSGRYKQVIGFFDKLFCFLLA